MIDPFATTRAPKTLLDVLREARELLSRPGGWTQEAPARNAAGADVFPHCNDACSFCVAGAISRASSGSGKVRHEAIAALIDALPGSLIDWNDVPGRTQPEVVALLDRAIARLDETR